MRYYKILLVLLVCCFSLMNAYSIQSKITSRFKTTAYNISENVRLNISQCFLSEIDLKDQTLKQQFSYWTNKLSIKLENSKLDKIGDVPVIFGKFMDKARQKYFLGLFKGNTLYYYTYAAKIQNDIEAFEYLKKIYQTNKLNIKGLKKASTTRNSTGISSPTLFH